MIRRQYRNDRFTAPTNSSCYHQEAGSAVKEENCKKGQLRFGVFFDGTGNDDQNPVEFTNVKKLFDVYPKKKPKPDCFEAIDSAYVRGVGSRAISDNDYKPSSFTPSDYKSDLFIGGAFGAGGFKRINHMVFELEQALIRYKGSVGCLPEVVFFDVFGFSRGAIQARHFVNVLKQELYKLKGVFDYKPKDFIVETLNVFDSVASFDPRSVLSYLNPEALLFGPQDYGWAFYIQPGWAKKIIHLIADDEFRVNFDGQRLVDSDLDYPSDFDTDALKEFICLGAHSDIGGGYKPVAHGRNSNDLAKVYLNQMYDLALENGVPFYTKPHSNDWNVPKKLDDSYSLIQDYYELYSNLKVEHKKFRERMWYLYGHNKGEHPAQITYKETKLRLDRVTKFLSTIRGKAPAEFSRSRIHYQNLMDCFNKLALVFGGTDNVYFQTFTDVRTI